LLDLEIIAQGKADEKHKNDRNNVLNNQPDLEAARWHGKTTAKTGAEQKFFDLGVDGERPHERHSVANRQHPNRVVISVRVGRASRVHERRKDFAITPVKEGHAHSEPYKRHVEVSAIIGKYPIKAHNADPEPMGEEPPYNERLLPPWRLV
jgi:hypothetical protein